MTAGGVVCIIVVGVAVGAYGREIYFEFVAWRESRHALKLLEEMAEKERRADEYAYNTALIRDWTLELREIEAAAQMYGELARTLEQIRDLDEIVGVEDV